MSGTGNCYYNAPIESLALAESRGAPWVGRCNPCRGRHCEFAYIAGWCVFHAIVTVDFRGVIDPADVTAHVFSNLGIVASVQYPH